MTITPDQVIQVGNKKRLQRVLKRLAKRPEVTYTVDYNDVASGKLPFGAFAEVKVYPIQ